MLTAAPLIERFFMVLIASPLTSIETRRRRIGITIHDRILALNQWRLAMLLRFGYHQRDVVPGVHPP
jgi:hypothetical protein